ncbi:MAG: phosphoribosylformylglycinamidine synthase, partial [Actinomycetaceae bacterium]|nr:phosphoribosylformylglycinamidine synthase [Actinomycetaceae bacterium]
MQKTVYRVFVEKKPEFAHEANFLASDIRDVLGISALRGVRVINRYDVELADDGVFDQAVTTVFSEPQVDTATDELDARGGQVFAVEYLPGQLDQSADSASLFIQIISQGERPAVRSARVYVLDGELGASDIAAIKNYIINPVEAREASLEKPETLEDVYDEPADVASIDGFRELQDSEAGAFIAEYGLAMDEADLLYLRDYFRSEDREPTLTEIRVIDTYWSDHCRHTTFMTEIDDVTFADPLLESAYADYISTRKALGRTKPVSLMDIATIAVKHLRANGQLDGLDESEEINACTVKIDVNVNGETEPWLLLFKNETHNHPTEIEPFGGAATCVGGAIRDPLSGRSYVYGAMRLTGAADPLTPADQTLPGKLSQRTIVTEAAHGYSSYGNQIGLATGIVDEIYHPGYAAKHMEVGAVIAAAPQENVRRERPEAGDVIILLGGATGRDGIGGATGSSKAHDEKSVEECGAEVQKGNAPEERKLQRLFRNPEASRLIKRCNDFGAGGVSVAIGELADGLHINLENVPKKSEGLDGTELAISESQERMAVVVEAGDTARFIELADTENLSAVEVARVTAEPRLVMDWRGKRIVDIAREFLDTNGAPKHTTAAPAAAAYAQPEAPADFAEGYRALVADLNVGSKRGLSERFDSTIGAGTVLMPFGGSQQLTPIQAMAHKVSVEQGDTDTCSLMSWGYNPFISEQSPYHGAYLAVVESMAKLVASGGYGDATYLSFQEYFEKLGADPARWGKPLAAVLGGFKAQMDLGVGAIGGKDSMSGSFGDLDVPPTLISFAVTTSTTERIISPE